LPSLNASIRTRRPRRLCARRGCYNVRARSR
jgi:hypothetical protein